MVADILAEFHEMGGYAKALTDLLHKISDNEINDMDSMITYLEQLCPQLQERQMELTQLLEIASR